MQQQWYRELPVRSLKGANTRFVSVDLMARVFHAHGTPPLHLLLHDRHCGSLHLSCHGNCALVCRGT